ncbi:MAG: EVE domain-containing protein, partial [Anaerolineae bacterium]|nr:EVE domain-containing protein [Anaerolineae bacterium]
MNYWINTISREHVLVGVEGGFTQANHGSPHNLRRMKRGDLLVFYSPKTQFQGGKLLKTFTAIGQITDDEPYQVQMREDFNPFRRNVTFFDCQEARIGPLINDLDFITDKQK